MRIYGYLKEIVELWFRKDGFDVKVTPHTNTYVATTSFSLPPRTTGSGTLVGTSETQTLTNKTIDGDDNTVQDLALTSIKTVIGDANKAIRRNSSGVVVSGPVTISDAGATAGITQLDVDNLRLDANTLSSTNTNGNITLDPDGTGIISALASVSVVGSLQSDTSLILEETGAGTDTITVQAPASIAASYTLTLPVDDGLSGQVLSTNGTGVLSWVSGGGDITNGGNTTGAAITIGTNDAFNLNFETNGITRMTLAQAGQLTIFPNTGAGTESELILGNDAGARGLTARYDISGGDAAFSTNGVDPQTTPHLQIQNAGGVYATQVRDGSAATPGLGFISDADTGLYRVAANSLGVSTNGTLRLTIDTTNHTSTLPYLAPDGTVGAPSFAFTSDADGTGTGLYRVATNSLGFAANGVNIGQYSSVGLWTFGVTTNATNSMTLRQGTSFSTLNLGGLTMVTADTATGDTFIGTNGQAATSAATSSIYIQANTFSKFADGSASDPGVGFKGDLDTGMYRPGSNSVGFSTGGTSAIVISSGQDLYVSRTAAGTDVAKLDLLSASGQVSASLKRNENNTGDVGVMRFRDGGDDLCGTININTTTNTATFNSISDSRRKTNLESFNGLDIINQLTPVKFEWVSAPGSFDYGLIAQDVHPIFPQAVTVGGESESNDPWMMDYSKLVGVLIAAIKELKARVESLEA